MPRITLKTLQAFQPFSDLHEEYLQQALQKLSLKKVSKGTLLFRRGIENLPFCYLLEGNIELINSAFESEALEAGTERASFPIIDDKVSQVSAMAKSSVSYFELDRDFVDLLLAWSQSAEDDTEQDDLNVELEEGEDWMSVLLDSPLFTQIPPGNIQQLFVKFETIDVAAKESIIKEGEHGDFFYVIAAGKARIKLHHGDEIILQAGQYFGEEALISEAVRNASVEMLSHGQLMRLNKSDFIQLLQKPLLNYIDIDEFKLLCLNNEIDLIDVRLGMERRMGAVPESKNLSLSGLRKKAMVELNPQKDCIITDDSGRRAEVAAQLLSQKGFKVRILKDSERLHRSAG